MTSRETILQLKDDRFAFKTLLKHFISSEKAIKEIVILATTKDDYPVQEHSSWLLMHVLDHKKESVSAYQHKIIDAFCDSQNQSVLRNLCNIMYKLPIIDYREGELLELLISHFKNLNNKVALHVYCLYKLKQFELKYPEIAPEINQLIALKEENDLPPSLKVAIRKYRTGKID